MSHFVDVSLIISADEYLRLYSGSAHTVVAQTVDGRSVRFPANILQSFVTREGIEGYFRIYFSDDGKFSGVEKLN